MMYSMHFEFNGLNERLLKLKQWPCFSFSISIKFKSLLQHHASSAGFKLGTDSSEK